MIKGSLKEAEAQDCLGSTEPKRAGHALDRFIGTWSAQQEAEVLRAVKVFGQVDEAFWQ